MRTAVISDIHANRVALEAVLADARSQGVEEVVCLGDVVGYGPEPEACVRLVREACAWTLAGNHDDAVSGRRTCEDFVDEAAEAVVRHYDALCREDRAWLGNLPYRRDESGWTAAHGSPDRPEEFGYVEDESSARAAFGACGSQLVFVGHTHEPGLFVTGSSGKVYGIEPVDFAVEEGKRYLVNVGSVGYPREKGGVCRSSYVIYDSDEGSVCFRFLPFAISSVITRGTGSRLLRRLRLFLGVLLFAVVGLIGLSVYLGRSEPEVVRIDEGSGRVVRSVEVAGLTASSKINLVVRFTNGPICLRERSFAADGKLINTTFKNLKISYDRTRKPFKGATRVEYAVMQFEDGRVPEGLELKASSK